METSAPRPTGQRGCRRDERGEVFPVAILFGGVLLTILLALHMTLFAMARTAVTTAADAGLIAAQGTPPGDPGCGSWADPVTGETVAPDDARACEGVLAAWEAMLANDAMVTYAGPAEVGVNETASVVWVLTRGAVHSPVFGFMEVIGRACGPLDETQIGGLAQADPEGCWQ